MFKYLPYILTIFVIFGPIIRYSFNKFIYLRYLEYIVLTLTIILLLMLNIKKSTLKKTYFIFFLLFSFFIINFHYSILFLGNEIIPSFIGLGSYLILLFSWYLYLNLYIDKFNITKYLNFIFYLTIFISLLGIYQYYFDMSMFGYASSINKIFSLDEYYKYSEIRITSIFTSIQIFSCFITLSIIMIIDNYKLFNKFQLMLFFPIILFASFLSGSRIAILTIFIFFSYKLLRKKKYFFIMLKIIVILVLLMSISGFFCTNLKKINSKSPIVRIFSRVVNFKINIKADNYRINLYKNNLIKNNSILMGHGIGKFNSLANKNRVGLESYFLAIIMETGIIGFFLYIFMLLKIFFIKIKIFSLKGVIISFIILMSFNQSFDSIVFFPFYFFMMYPLIINKKENKV